MNLNYVKNLTKEEKLNTTVTTKETFFGTLLGTNGYYANGIHIPFEDALDIQMTKIEEMETPFVSIFK